MLLSIQFLTILNSTKEWQDAGYNKRKYLKADSFGGLLDLINELKGQEQIALENLLYLLSYTYLSEDKIYETVFKKLIHKFECQPAWLLVMIQQNQEINQALFVKHVFLPLLENIKKSLI